MTEDAAAASDPIVPDDVIPRGTLPPLRYREMPEPVSLARMLGPSIMLAGLALGSGEYIFWPYLTFRSRFTFFWACLLGVTVQYFINMEIVRWSLATGESAITGFCRRSRHWAWVFLLLNIIPWMFPAWALGTAQLISWSFWGAEFSGESVRSPYIIPIAIAGLWLCGIVLTAGPVVYETVEKIQAVLVTAIVVAVIILACLVVRVDAWQAQLAGIASLGLPELGGGLTAAALLGAVAFAGAGGTMNLGQSNYIKDKRYGMGRYIGRITSPITGQEEAVSETGYHFPHTPENLARWRLWWRRAGTEHFCSFYLTCLLCLVLLTLISYSLFFDADGSRRVDAGQYQKDVAFVWGEALELGRIVGGPAKLLFLWMGVCILLTTEFGVLDVTSRISTDIVRVNWANDSPRWTASRLYYLFLWLTILLGTAILLLGPDKVKESLFLFKITASLNGGVMFLYCLTLLHLNLRCLPPDIRMSWWRALIMLGAVAFFGAFAAWAIWSEALAPWLTG